MDQDSAIFFRVRTISFFFYHGTRTRDNIRSTRGSISNRRSVRNSSTSTRSLGRRRVHFAHVRRTVFSTRRAHRSDPWDAATAIDNGDASKIVSFRFLISRFSRRGSSDPKGSTSSRDANSASHVTTDHGDSWTDRTTIRNRKGVQFTVISPDSGRDHTDADDDHRINHGRGRQDQCRHFVTNRKGN